MSVLKTYNIIGSAFTGKLVFKYDLNGFLQAFEMEDCAELNQDQKEWLFSAKRFPYREEGINMFKAIRNFTVVEGEFKIEFNDFWGEWKPKIGKEAAIKAWKKLSDNERVKAVAGIKEYDAYLARKRGIEKARASTYLNQKYFNDAWGSAN